MDLFIKQRVFSWGQKFEIYDERGNAVYRCEGEVFSLGHRLRIFDQNNREVVYIKQKLFKLLPHYEIYIDGELVTSVVKKFAFFKHDFFYDNLNWSIEGDFFAHDYRITCGAENVVTLSKRWFTWGDTYDLSINEKYNPLLALASCIVIDCACHSSSQHSR